MKLRLSQSERLVDLGGIADLKDDHASTAAASSIGAMATHAAVALVGRRRSAPSRRSPSSPAASATRWCATWARSAARSPTPTRRRAIRRRCSGSARRCRPTSAAIAGRRVLHRPVRDGAAAGRADHRGRASRRRRRRRTSKYRQPASRFALIGVFVAQTAGGVRVAS